MELADQSPDAAARVSAGERLRAAREAQELSLDEVAVRTRVPKRMLEAIETGDHAALPATTYSAGFVKVYAQVVGLDPRDLAQHFRQDLGGGVTQRYHPAPFEPADPARVPSRLLATIAVAIALLIAIGYGVWRGGSLWGYGADERARLAAGTERAAAPDGGSAPTAEGAPVVAPVPEPAAAPVGPVVVAAIDTVWLRIYERGGKTLFTGEMPAGQRFEIPADSVDPLVRTGRPEALRITVGTREIPRLGSPSTLIRDASLARDALLARVAPADAPAAPPAAGSAPAPLQPLVPQPADR